MNNQDMDNFFKRQEDQFASPYKEETVEAGFDSYVIAKSGKSFGFYIDEEFKSPDTGEWDWSVVVWIPRRMFEDGMVSVRRLQHNAGFVVTMPLWFASKKGII